MDGAPAPPAIGNSFGHAIGLTKSEPPEFTAGNLEPLRAGNCYTLRFGNADEKYGCASLSAMLRISEDGNPLIGRLDQTVS